MRQRRGQLAGEATSHEASLVAYLLEHPSWSIAGLVEAAAASGQRGVEKTSNAVEAERSREIFFKKERGRERADDTEACWEATFVHPDALTRALTW